MSPSTIKLHTQKEAYFVPGTASAMLLVPRLLLVPLSGMEKSAKVATFLGSNSDKSKGGRTRFCCATNAGLE